MEPNIYRYLVIYDGKREVYMKLPASWQPEKPMEEDPVWVADIDDATIFSHTDIDREQFALPFLQEYIGKKVKLGDIRHIMVLPIKKTKVNRAMGGKNRHTTHLRPEPLFSHVSSIMVW